MASASSGVMVSVLSPMLPEPRCGAPGMTSSVLAPMFVTVTWMATDAPLADLHHGDDRGHADNHAQHGQRRAHHVAPQGLQRDPRRVARPRAGCSACVGGSRSAARPAAPQPSRGGCVRVSSTICPSAMRITRSAWRATSASCVTSRMVMPFSTFRRRKICRISLPVCESRLPGRLVGQQHRGMVDQRPGDGHALLLAAGEFGRASDPAATPGRPWPAVAGSAAALASGESCSAE